MDDKQELWDPLEGARKNEHQKNRIRKINRKKHSLMIALEMREFGTPLMRSNWKVYINRISSVYQYYTSPMYINDTHMAWQL